MVEPNDNLRVQTAEKLGPVHYNVNVTTIEKLYQEGPWGDIIILDEYDLIIDSNPYFLHGKTMSGLWQFRDR